MLKRFFKGGAVSLVFAKAIVDVADVFRAFGPEQRITPFGNDFLAVFITGYGQFGDVFAFGKGAKQRKKIAKLSLNFSPKFRKQRVCIDFFSLAELKNGIAKRLNVFFLPPVVEEQF